jgi:hypothetical protein
MGMAESHIMAALIRKRADIAGQLKTARRSVSALQADLARVD